jgi:hypothetical protein
MSEYIEVDGQEVEKAEYILDVVDKEKGEQEPRVKIDVQGEAIWTGKTKALIIIMPQYINDIPQVINVGLELEEIQDAISIADGAYHDLDTYKKESERLQREVDRLQIKLDKAEEEGWINK